MARYAKARIYSGASVPDGYYIEINIRGQALRFVSSAWSSYQFPFYYFAQAHSGVYGYIDAQANLNSLTAAIVQALADLGEARYEVRGWWGSDSLGFPNSITVEVVAREYSDELNFTSVVSSGGSYQFASIVSTNDNPPSVKLTVTEATCFGSSTGIAHVQVSGGIGPYAFLWSDGSTEQHRTDLPAGSHSLRVTDSAKPQPLIPELPPDSPYQVFSEDHAAVIQLQVVVGQNSQIQVVGTIGEKTITLQTSGGVAPYTYQWSDGVNTKDRVDVEPGVYTCLVRDAVGCSQEVTFSIALERFFFSRNPVLLKLQAANHHEKPNLRFICEVWVEPEYLSGNFMLATPEAFEHPADADGRTQFDVREILDAFVEPHLPDFDQRQVKRADKAFKRFYLRHTEAYGDPVVLDPFTVQDNRYVLLGGLDDAEHFAETYFNSYRPNRKPFFTWDPAIRKSFPDQPEYLYFMPDSFELTDFRVKVKVVFTDGSTQTIEPFTQEGIRRFELYAIPVGHDQLELGALQPGKAVRSWDVYVADGFNNVLSETRRFTIDTGNYQQVRYFLYANSVGGYNSLAATGRARLSVDAQAQLMERHRPVDALSGDTVIVSKYSQRMLKLSTGHKSRAEMLALQDFLNSEDVKLVGPDRYIPGRLADTSAEVDDDTKTVQGISFDFVLPKMHSYTPTLHLAGYADDSELLKPLHP